MDRMTTASVSVAMSRLPIDTQVSSDTVITPPVPMAGTTVGCV